VAAAEARREGGTLWPLIFVGVTGPPLAKIDLQAVTDALVNVVLFKGVRQSLGTQSHFLAREIAEFGNQDNQGKSGKTTGPSDG
jgi:hypothetical protein